MLKIEHDKICKVATTLRGSEMVVRLIDSRKLTDKQALERALEWLRPEARLTVILIALKPMAKQRSSFRKRRINDNVENAQW